MSRLFTRAVVAALVGAGLSVAALLVFTWWHPGLAFEMDRDLPRAVAGVSPVERHGEETYAWTGAHAQVALPGLDRGMPWTCIARLRGARPPGVAQPQVQFAVDGVTLRTVAATNTYTDVEVQVPTRPERSGLSLTISSEPTWVPGPGDPRHLGVQVDRLACRPTGRAWPPSRALLSVAVSGAALGAAMGLSGLTLPLALLFTAAAALGQAWLVSAGTAPFGAWPDRVSGVGLWVAVFMLVTIKTLELPLKRTLSIHALSAIAIAFLVLHLKLLGLLHPSKPIVDALFHAHRFEGVQAGRYFFTQPMPGGVQFPYAIAFYVFALPWAAFTNDHVLLLRVVICVVEACAGMLLYPMVVRAWGERLAGVFAVAFFSLVPLAFITVGNANLTNAFGRSAALVAVAGAACWSLRGRFAIAEFAGVTLLVAVALLSHVSTLSLLVATLLAAAVLLWWFGGVDERAPAYRIAASVILASVLSVVLYYGHFADAFRSLERVRSGAAIAGVSESPSASDAGASAAAPAAVAPAPAAAPRGTITRALPGRLALAVGISSRAVGWPMFVLALVGMWRLGVHGVRDRLGAVLLGWGATWVVFVAVVMSAPVDERFQRYAVEFLDRVNYTLSPAFAILAGLAASWAWHRHAGTRLVALLLTTGAVVLALQQWLAWIA